MNFEEVEETPDDVLLQRLKQTIDASLPLQLKQDEAK